MESCYVNSRGPSKIQFNVSMNFILMVGSSIGVTMLGNIIEVCFKQVFHLNSIHIYKVPLYVNGRREREEE